jgi:hypothetical protein
MTKQQLTEEARLAVVENNINLLSVTVKEGFAETKESIKEINAKLDRALPAYATKQELESLKKKSSLQVWVTGTLSAILGIVMTILVQNYFKG